MTDPTDGPCKKTIVDDLTCNGTIQQICFKIGVCGVSHCPGDRRDKVYIRLPIILKGGVGSDLLGTAFGRSEISMMQGTLVTMANKWLVRSGKWARDHPYPVRQ